MSSLDHPASQIAPSTIVAPGAERLCGEIDPHATQEAPALRAVADYFRDAGLRDPEILQRESLRIVAAARAKHSADGADGDVELTTTALQQAIRQLEAWLYDVPRTESESSAGPPDVAVDLPELLRRVGATVKRNRPEELDGVVRDCSTTVVPPSRPRPMRRQRLKLVPAWCRRLFDPARALESLVERTNETTTDGKPLYPPSLNPLRLALMGLTLLSAAGGTWWFVRELPDGGMAWLDVPLTGLFAVLFLWVAFSFWTATFGLILVLRKQRRSAEPRIDDKVTPLPPTAVLMTVYNEDPQIVFANLRAIAGSLQTTGRASDFHLFVLSDATDPRIRLEE
jgi:hypothetical protein